MPKPFPLSKVADVAGDTEPLTIPLATLGLYPDVLNGQHKIRSWEYAMALTTISEWAAARSARVQEVHRAHVREAHPGVSGVVFVVEPSLQICDVGGAGSNFWQALTSVTTAPIVIVDAAAPAQATLRCGVFNTVATVARDTLEHYATYAQHGQFDVLTCISVIEHIPDTQLRKFFKAAHMLLRPGGLLFLTTDYWDADGPDVAHFHWMRERIYNPEEVQQLRRLLRECGFQTFGTSDWTYAGPQVYDYSVCSLALVKK